MGWYDALKDAVTIAKKAGNIELQGQLLDLQQEMQDMQQENFDLKKKIGALETIIEQKRKVVYNDSRTAVYELDEQGNRNGPYCTHCWEFDSKLITPRDLTNGYHKCTHCNSFAAIP